MNAYGRERPKEKTTMNELHTLLSYLPESTLRAIQRTLEKEIAKDQGNFRLDAYREAVKNALILLKAGK